MAIFTKGNKDGEDRDARSLNAVVILDVSGSMGSGLTSKGEGCRIVLAKEAILMLFSKLRPNDSFSLITFNNSATVIIPLSKVSSINFDELTNRLSVINASGGTTLSSGLNAANEQFSNFFKINNDAKQNY